VSVRLSRPSTAAAVVGGLAAERSAGRRYRSIAAGTSASYQSADALSSNGAVARRSAANMGSAL